MESPVRKLLKRNDYNRHKLLRKIKRRRKAAAEQQAHAAEKALKKKLRITPPKFEGGKNPKDIDITYVDNPTYNEELGLFKDDNGRVVGDSIVLPELNVIGNKQNALLNQDVLDLSRSVLDFERNRLLYERNKTTDSGFWSLFEKNVASYIPASGYVSGGLHYAKSYLDDLFGDGGTARYERERAYDLMHRSSIPTAISAAAMTGNPYLLGAVDGTLLGQALHDADIESSQFRRSENISQSTLGNLMLSSISPLLRFGNNIVHKPVISYDSKLGKLMLKKQQSKVINDADAVEIDDVIKDENGNTLYYTKKNGNNIEIIPSDNVLMEPLMAQIDKLPHPFYIPSKLGMTLKALVNPKYRNRLYKFARETDILNHDDLQSTKTILNKGRNLNSIFNDKQPTRTIGRINLQRSEPQYFISNPVLYTEGLSQKQIPARFESPFVPTTDGFIVKDMSSGQFKIKVDRYGVHKISNTSVSKIQNSDDLLSAIRDHYDKLSQKVGQYGAVVGSTRGIAEGSFAGVPGDDDILTTQSLAPKLAKLLEATTGRSTGGGYKVKSKWLRPDLYGDSDFDIIEEDSKGLAKGTLAHEIFATLYPEKYAQLRYNHALSQGMIINNSPYKTLGQDFNETSLPVSADGLLKAYKELPFDIKSLKDIAGSNKEKHIGRMKQMLSSSNKSVISKVATTIDTIAKQTYGINYKSLKDQIEDFDYSDVDANKYILSKLHLPLSLAKNEPAMRNIIDYLYFSLGTTTRRINTAHRIFKKQLLITNDSFEKIFNDAFIGNSDMGGGSARGNGQNESFGKTGGGISYGSIVGANLVNLKHSSIKNAKDLYETLTGTKQATKDQLIQLQPFATSKYIRTSSGKIIPSLDISLYPGVLTYSDFLDFGDNSSSTNKEISKILGTSNIPSIKERGSKDLYVGRFSLPAATGIKASMSDNTGIEHGGAHLFETVDVEGNRSSDSNYTNILQTHLEKYDEIYRKDSIALIDDVISQISDPQIQTSSNSPISKELILTYLNDLKTLQLLLNKSIIAQYARADRRNTVAWKYIDIAKASEKIRSIIAIITGMFTIGGIGYGLFNVLPTLNTKELYNMSSYSNAKTLDKITHRLNNRTVRIDNSYADMLDDINELGDSVNLDNFDLKKFHEYYNKCISQNDKYCKHVADSIENRGIKHDLHKEKETCDDSYYNFYMYHRRLRRLIGEELAKLRYKDKK